MSDQDRYLLQGFDEYIRQGKPLQRERSEAWKVGMGLQQVDRLNTSEYLYNTAKRHIEGEISIQEAKQLIDSYYQSSAERQNGTNNRTEEADKVATRITELMQEHSFSFTPAQYLSIHRRLFDGIFKSAGRIRDYNITKNEWILGGRTVYYASADTISATLDYDFKQEREFSYADLNIDEAIAHLTRFCANLWQIHPFCEGNTRTTAVFMIKYLHTLGFNVVNDVFAEHSWYFRNALVRANYSDLTKGVTETTEYLEHFFRKLLLGEEHDLRNRVMHIAWRQTDHNDQVQSAKSTEGLFSKCKNCTLNEVAVLRAIQRKPSATQKEIASEIGKSERTVKSITISLQERNILRRVNGKRDGFWEISDMPSL